MKLLYLQDRLHQINIVIHGVFIFVFQYFLGFNVEPINVVLFPFTDILIFFAIAKD